MRVALTTFLILGFISIAVFGFFGMDHASGHSGAGGCIASTVQSADCPEKGDPVGSAAFHLNAFKSFSTAIVDSSFAGALFASLAFILAFFLVLFLKGTNPILQRLEANQKKRKESFEFPFYAQLNRWLALHENSPSVA